MLALRDGGRVDGVVQVVGRRVVHDVDVGIVEQRLVAAVRLACAERLGLALRRRLAAARHGDDVDVPEASNRFHMVRPDEPGAHDAHPDAFQP